MFFLDRVNGVLLAPTRISFVRWGHGGIFEVGG